MSRAPAAITAGVRAWAMAITEKAFNGMDGHGEPEVPPGGYVSDAHPQQRGCGVEAVHRYEAGLQGYEHTQVCEGPGDLAAGQRIRWDACAQALRQAMALQRATFLGERSL